ncbi:MAG: ATP-binding protein [Candidatus Aminicenantes bacterium RBG_16_66_30]
MKRSLLFVIVPLVAVLTLGTMNVVKKARWRDVTDGVTWRVDESGLRAIRVDPDSEAFLRAGIRNGDVLTAINKVPVKTKIDVLKGLWQAAATDQSVTYDINKEGMQIYPTFYPQRKAPNPIYYYLVLVGLMTLAIALIVFFNSRGVMSLPYVFFYLLALTFAGLMIFSPTGEMTALDTVFYGLDKLGFLAFPPLLLHFFMIFPLRKRFLKTHPSLRLALYAPAVLLLATRVRMHIPFPGPLSEAAAVRTQDALEHLELLHFAVFALVTLAILFDSIRRAPNILLKKQLRIIVSGLAFGVLPSTIFYVGPFLAGGRPSTGAELTVLLMALIPLVFSYSISRYRLVDIEVFLKKAATLTFSFFVIASVYFFVSSRTRLFSESRLNAIVFGALAIVLGATLFTPLKRMFQTLLDRAIYKRSYEYRKTLLSITRDLNRERDLSKLAHSLLEAIANALNLKRLALFLADESDRRSFQVLKTRGEEAGPAGRIVVDDWLAGALRDRDWLGFISASESEPARAAMEKLSAAGYYHVLPLRVEDKVVGCLVMGKKQDGSFFSREDWELLTTISGPAALALENADLYGRESVRAMEMQRLKDYSEDIIESLTVGVSVIDEAGLVIGWNRVLEEQVGIRKEAALGRTLQDVLGAAPYGALFPEEGQTDFRLLSEITLETAGGKRVFDIARTPLLDNALRPYGTIIVFEDITDKIRLQQQLLTSEKLASIGLLSAGVAHEINTPLTGISSYIQMLQKKLADTHYAQILEKVEAQTDRVAKIIKNLLTFARSPSDAAFQRVDLKQSLEEILSLIDYKLKNMNIRLVLELATVPPIYAQGERLQQVFINIILNALDAMPGGGELGIRLALEDGAEVVRISDTGTGIRPEHRSRIFDPFFTTKGVGKGTGLGLSISYAIIKEHDGRIDVQSEVGRGSTFTITLPAGREGPRKAAGPGARTSA